MLKVVYRLRKIMAYTIGLIISLVIISLILLNNPSIQRQLIDYATNYIYRHYHADISLNKIRLSLSNALIIEDLLLKDQSQDTIIYVKETKLQLGSLHKYPNILRNLTLYQSKVKLQELSLGKWNYSFLLSDSDSSKPQDFSWLKYIPPILLNQIRLKVQSSTQKILSEAHYLELILKPTEFKKSLPEINIEQLNSDALKLELFSEKPQMSTINSVQTPDFKLLLHSSLKNLFELPFNYQIQHINLLNSWIHLHDTHKSSELIIKGSISSNKLIHHGGKFEQEFKVENLRVGDWFLDGLTLNSSLDPENLHIKEFSLNQKDMLTKLKINIRYPNILNTDYSTFMNNIQGNGMVSVRNIDSNFSSEYQNYLGHLPEYLPKNYNLQLQPTNFNFTSELFNIDSLSIYHNQKPLAKLGLQLHNWIDKQQFSFSLSYLLLYLDNSKYPWLFNKITKFWEENNRPYLSEMLIKMRYEGTLQRGAGFLNINNQLLNLEQDFSIQHGIDSSLDIITRYNIQNPNGTLFPHELSFEKINGRARILVEKSGEFNIENYQNTIHNLLANGHFYKTILINGFLIHKILNGELEIDDPGAQANINYNLDLSNSQNIALNSNMNLHNIDWKSLGFVEDNLETKLTIESNLTFKNNTDGETDILGNIQLKRVHCTNNQGEFYLDDIFLEANQKEHKNTLSIRSAELGHIYLRSSMPFKEVPIHLKNLLHDFLPYKFPYYSSSDPNSTVELDVQLRNFLPFNLLIHPYLQDLDSLDFHFSSENNTNKQKNQLHIELHLPMLKWDSLIIVQNNLEINSFGNNKFFITGELKQFSYTNLLELRDIFIKDFGEPNKIYFSALSDNYTIKFDLTSFFDSEFTEISLNSLKLNLVDNSWQLKNTTKLRLSANSFELSNLRLVGQRDQDLELNIRTNQGQIHEGDFHVRNLDLNIISKLFPDNSFKLAGLINLNTSFLSQDPNTPEYVIDFTIENFQFNADSIGQIQGDMHYIKGSQNFTLNAYAKNPEYNFNIYKNTNSNPEELLNIHLNKVRARILQVYTQSFFEDIEGYLSGDLVLKRKQKTLFLSGSTKLQEVFLSVDYTKCRYQVAPDRIVVFENGDIIFPQIPIFDKNQVEGLVDGVIHLPLNDFSKFKYNFQIQGENLLGLNTQKQDNPIFYGHASGDIKLNVHGNGIQDSLFISIIPNNNTFCNIDINSSNSQNSNTGALKFLSPATKILNKSQPTEVDTIKRRTQSHLSHPIYTNPKIANQPEVFYVQINLDGNNSEAIESNIYLNRVGSNKIYLKGIPHLQLIYNSNNGLTMTGSYKITEGNLQLTLLENFQLKKEFNIDPSFNNFVQWSGDITEPRLNLRVQHLLERVPLNNLESLTNALGLSNAQGTPTRVATSTSVVNNTSGDHINISLADLEILVMVSGILSKMEFNFDIRPSSGNISSGNTNNTLNTYLQNLRQNQEEMKVQVSALLLFNMFSIQSRVNTLSSSNPQINISNYTNQLLSSAVGSMVLSQINNSLNNLIKSKKINLEFIYNAYNTYQMGTVEGSNALSIQDLRNQIGINMNLKMTDRFNLRIAPGIDFNLYNNNAKTNNTNAQVGFLPNVNLAYNVTKDGALTFNAFNTSSFDNLIQSQRNRAGISFLLSKDFDIPVRIKKKKIKTLNKIKSQNSLKK